MIFALVCLILLVVGIVCICYWFQGTLGGAFVGFIPITLICVLGNYADQTGHSGFSEEHLQQSAKEAFYIAIAITFAPFLWRRLKQLVSRKDGGRNGARNAGNAR